MAENYYLLDDMEKYDKNFQKELYEDKSEKELIPIFREYYKANLPVDLLTWCRVNNPGDEMIYKEVFWKQILFVRDTIPNLIYNSYEEYQNNPVLVVNTHRSKSICLPVCQINLEHIKIIVRNNFYDWKISVDSNKDIKTDFLGLFDYKEKVNSIYCEGFKEEQVFDCYENNKKQFTLQLNNSHEVYMFMYILKNHLKAGVK